MLRHPLAAAALVLAVTLIAGAALAGAIPAAAPGVAAAAVPPAIPPAPDAAAAARLAKGEILLSSRPHGPRSLSEEIGQGVIDAPAARIFDALTDFAHYQEWMPFVKRSDAVAQGDGSLLSFQSLDLPFPAGNRHYRIHAWSAPSVASVATTAAPGNGGTAWRLWWAYVPGSGNVADHHGWWVLQSFGAGRTLGTCLLYTDPGSMPAWALHRGTSQTMPYIFSGLRQQIHRSRYDRGSAPNT